MPVHESTVLADPTPSPSPATIIDPPQYSIAWLILAVLCVIVIVAIIVGVLRISRAVVSRRAYRERPDEPESLKAEFLRSVNDIAARHEDGAIDERTGHLELTAVMRRFVRRTTGHDVTSQDVGTLIADPRTRDVGELIARLYEPDFAPASDVDLEGSVHRAREVIRRWS
ncbi:MULTISPECIES: hypothetical protein [Brachybacterium]|uniref:DUF4129 domain-containing protein n=1 Tax=Brachybacterium kimchii TaxID=2942909 RepID=A0ABY4N6R0_9MICO|nr:hypothetical protein [Brachybacterium kimchii]UQN30240.1 hypothetical protein M4486_02520 [Brachybacterium kimchii]